MDSHTSIECHVCSHEDSEHSDTQCFGLVPFAMTVCPCLLSRADIDAVQPLPYGPDGPAREPFTVFLTVGAW